MTSARLRPGPPRPRKQGITTGSGWCSGTRVTAAPWVPTFHRRAQHKQQDTNKDGASALPETLKISFLRNVQWCSLVVCPLSKDMCAYLQTRDLICILRFHYYEICRTPSNTRGQTILGHTGPCQAMPGHAGPCWAILGPCQKHLAWITAHF